MLLSYDPSCSSLAVWPDNDSCSGRLQLAMNKNQIDPDLVVFVVVCAVFLAMGLLLAGVKF